MFPTNTELRFEAGTSQIRRRGTNHLAKFGEPLPKFRWYQNYFTEWMTASFELTIPASIIIQQRMTRPKLITEAYSEWGSIAQLRILDIGTTGMWSVWRSSRFSPSVPTDKVTVVASTVLDLMATKGPQLRTESCHSTEHSPCNSVP
jgi:hypothetical protein